MCSGCATVTVAVGLRAAYAAFQVVKFAVGSGDEIEQQESEVSDGEED